MAKLTKDDMIQAVEEMSVLELSDLVKALEEKFGVTAAPMAVAAAPGTGAEAGEAKEEQTVFNVVLAEGGANKIAVIKAVRELVPTLGLTDAKALVDGAPKEILSGVNKETAEEAKKKIETAGGKAQLQ
jgi:large subunit ribosomal protein L7/L12